MTTTTFSSYQKAAYSILLLGSYIYMMTWNSLANAIPINGLTTGELSDRLPNFFVPYGGTFAIWGLIFLLLLGLVIVETTKIIRNQTSLPKSFYKLISFNMVLNGSWILAWHFLYYSVSLLIMFGILTTLILLFRMLEGKPKSIFQRTTISIYMGWISVATVANITALLVSTGWEGGPIAAMNFASILILVVVVLTYFMLLRKSDIAYSLVIAWALFGITQKQPAESFFQPGSLAFYAYLLVLVGIVAVAILKFRNRTV